VLQTRLGPYVLLLSSSFAREATFPRSCGGRPPRSK